MFEFVPTGHLARQLGTAAGSRKTHIMYEAGLNLKQLNLYLGELTANGALNFEQAQKRYYTTERGRAFIRAFPGAVMDAEAEARPKRVVFYQPQHSSGGGSMGRPARIRLAGVPHRPSGMKAPGTEFG